MLTTLSGILSLSPISRNKKGVREKKVVGKENRRNSICFGATFLNQKSLMGIRMEKEKENMGLYRNKCSPSRVFCVCAICCASSIQEKFECKGECLKQNINQCDECYSIEIGLREYQPPPITTLVRFYNMGINKEFGYSDSRGDEVIKMVASLVEMAPEYVKSTVVAIDIDDSPDGNKGEKDISINFSTKEITHKLMGIIEMTLKGKSENYGIARIDDNFISVFISIKPTPVSTPEKRDVIEGEEFMKPKTH